MLRIVRNLALVLLVSLPLFSQTNINNGGSGGGGGSGTVTNFTAGNLSPLFTTSVANGTTTPALTFSLTAAAANTLFGNATGSSGSASYFAPAGDVSLSVGSFTVKALNGTVLSSLATGLLKNTTGTGVPSIAASSDVIGLWTGTCSSSTYLNGAGACATPSGSGTVNSGTANHLAFYATSTNAVSNDPALTDNGTDVTSTEPVIVSTSGASSVAVGTDNSSAGTVLLSNGSASAHTILGSAATTTNTILGPATAPTTLDLLYCVVSSTTCTLTDTGYAYNAIPLTDIATQGANTVLANVTGSTAHPTAASIPSGIQNYVAGTGYNQGTGHQIEVPKDCADSSGSGTAQSCNTSPTFTPASPDCITYTTTTTNSGTGLTTNVNSLGAKSIAIPGSSGWTTTLTASIIPANKPQLLCYDGTNWDDMQTGTVSASGGGSSFALMGNNSGSYAVSPEYFAFPGTANGPTTSAANVASVISTAQTIDTLYVQFGVATAAASSVTYTLYYGATTGAMSATAVTCTIGAAAQTCSDTTHSFTTVAGGVLALQVTYTGTPGGTAPNTLSVRAH
jgi:hypothetical protein